MSKSKTPDFVEPFVGWKGLLADEEGSLWSPQMPTPWPVGEPLAATCERKKHAPPATSCTCGVYAVKSFEDLHAHGYNWGETEAGKVWIVAEVSLWGACAQGGSGTGRNSPTRRRSTSRRTSCRWASASANATACPSE